MMIKVRMMLTADVELPEGLAEQLNADVDGDTMNVTVQAVLDGIDEGRYKLSNVVLEEVVGD